MEFRTFLILRSIRAHLKKSEAYSRLGIIVFLCPLMIYGCGGGGGSGTSAGGDLDSPAVDLQLNLEFPPSRVLYTGAALTVRGSISSAAVQEAEILVDAGLVKSDAIINEDGSWIAREVPIADTPETQLTISADFNGQLQTITQSIVRSPAWDSIDGLALNLEENLAYVADPATDAIFRVDLDTGKRDIVSDEHNGEGPDFFNIYDVVIDEAFDRLLTIDAYDRYISTIDVTTGDRSRLAFTTPRFSRTLNIKFDPDSRKIYTGDTNANAVYMIDLDSGELTNVSSGPGPFIRKPHAIELDVSRNRLFVADSLDLAIYEIDLTTMEKTLIVDNTMGSGPLFDNLFELVYHQGNDELFVSSLTGVIKVDLATGERSTVRSNSTDELFVSAIRDMELDIENNRVIATDAGMASLLAIDLDNGHTRLISGAADSPKSLGKPAAIELVNSTAAAYTNYNSSFVLLLDLSSGELLQKGSRLDFPSDIVYDQTNERFLVLDWLSDTIHSVTNTVPTPPVDPNPDVIDPNSIGFNSIVGIADFSDTFFPSSGSFPIPFIEENVLISGDGVGAGPAFILPETLAVNSDATVAAVLGGDRVYLVDLLSGDRRLLFDSQLSVSEQPRFGGVLFDDQHNRLLATDSNNGTIVAINLDTGSTSLISSADVGTGDSLLEPSDLSYDETQEGIYVTDGKGQSVVHVDLQTGDRRTISSPLIGDGDLLREPTDLCLVPSKGYILVIDSFSIYAVDIETGNRVLIAS